MNYSYIYEENDAKILVDDLLESLKKVGCEIGYETIDEKSYRYFILTDDAKKVYFRAVGQFVDLFEDFLYDRGVVRETVSRRDDEEREDAPIINGIDYDELSAGIVEILDRFGIKECKCAKKNAGIPISSEALVVGTVVKPLGMLKERLQAVFGKAGKYIVSEVEKGSGGLKYTLVPKKARLPKRFGRFMANTEELAENPEFALGFIMVYDVEPNEVRPVDYIPDFDMDAHFEKIMRKAVENLQSKKDEFDLACSRFIRMN